MESYVGVPVVRADGSVFGTLCTLDTEPATGRSQDLECFQLLASLIAKHLENEELARERELFLDAIGHDLRSPIHAISLGTDLIRAQAGSLPEICATADRIASSTRRLDSMVDDLVDVTRGRLGRCMSIEPEHLDAARLLESVVSSSPPRARGARVRVEVDCDPRVSWDRTRITQLVQNLVNNACHHGESGRPITVRLEGSADRVTISVHNHGAAIDQASLPTLFDPFVSAPSERPTGSLGLGLYIVARIAEAHGGEIEVRSQAGRGTEFRVSLPRHVSSSAREAPVDAASARS